MADEREAEEYRFCHQLLIENISILEKTEVFATGAIAASMVFSASASDATIAKLSAMVPLVIAILGTVRWIGINGVISKINNYLVILGSKLPEGGWTQYYRSQKPLSLKFSRWLIWGILIAASGVFAAYTYGWRSFEPPKSLADAAHIGKSEETGAQPKSLPAPAVVPPVKDSVQTAREPVKSAAEPSR